MVQTALACRGFLLRQSLLLAQPQVAKIALSLASKKAAKGFIQNYLRVRASSTRAVVQIRHT